MPAGEDSVCTAVQIVLYTVAVTAGLIACVLQGCPFRWPMLASYGQHPVCPAVSVRVRRSCHQTADIWQNPARAQDPGLADREGV